MIVLALYSFSKIVRKQTLPVSAPHLAAAVVGVGANALALADLDSRFRVVGGCGAHALLDLAGHGQESLLDVAGVLGRSLEEGDSQAVGKFLQPS